MLKGADTAQNKNSEHVLWFESIGIKDIPRVGGKNASLGEMIGNLASKGIRVPEGFATTTDAFRKFVDEAGLKEKARAILTDVDSDNPSDVAQRGKKIRAAFLKAEFPEELKREIGYSYWELGRRLKMPNPSVAIRSSATAEDLAGASVAGQHETMIPSAWPACCAMTGLWQASPAASSSRTPTTLSAP